MDNFDRRSNPSRDSTLHPDEELPNMRKSISVSSSDSKEYTREDGQSRQEPMAQGSNASEPTTPDIEKGSQTPEDARIDSKENDAEPVDDSNIVWWDSDTDPENPFNWPKWRKLTNCGLISCLTLIEPLASSIFAPGIPKLMEDFNSKNTELAGFVMSVYVLGFAFGPMLLAPMSEMYGRIPVYHFCNVFFLAFTIACAVAPSLNALIVFRFLAGTFGAAPMTNGGGSIADMFRAEDRAGVMAVFSIGPLIGPIIGPVIGGFLTDAKGWRWDFWVITMVAGAITVAMVFVMRESYAPVILERKAQRLRKETGNEALRSKLDTGLSNTALLKRCIVRPAKLLIYSPICSIFAVYLGLLYGYLYLLFSSVPYVFEEYYDFGTKTVGLVYLGLGIGSFVGMGWFAWDSDKQIKIHSAAGTLKPEVRLKLLPIASIIFPAGFFIYGWTADYQVHWIAPILGLAVIGIGNLASFMAVCMYLVDAYEMYAASALAANTIIRSIAGALLPLCGLRMYNALGLGWGNTMLGLIAVGLIPVPFLVVRYGEMLRNKFDMSTL